ncbi:MAG TPA: hypothetical protein VMH28_24560 [Candidatus Acidoferrales bacterium]|nr:hypothetical protein [Candidatus Acidoferrales bacterium]
MSKPSLRILAVLLSAAIVIVLFAGLDNLPAEVRKQIAAERTAYASAQKQFDSAKSDVTRDVSQEPALFAAIPSARAYADRLSRGQTMLASASQDLNSLAALEKRNRRTDREQAENLLRHERQLRDGAVAEVEAVRKDAAQWLERKQHLPQEAQDMDRDHKAVLAVDLAGLAGIVQKAETDWPEKKPDLDTRLTGVQGSAQRAEDAWKSSADARRAASANDTAKVDYAALFGAADTLKTAAADLPKQSESLKSLTAQLYTSWDKLLVDMQSRGGKYEQRIRTVTTRVADASSKNGTTTSDESWTDVSRAQYQAQERDLGMAIEHKPAGKYDIESERVAQPAGFAYMAPPGQSNQYGYWNNSGGHSFWVWYGQYALMRDLLFNRDYRPLDRYEYENYRTYQERRQTYYGEAPGGGAKYGTGSATTQERYSGSTFARSGGFKDSKYASKPGSYGSSKYASPGGDRSPQTFGKHQAGPPPPSSHSYRPPSPRPSMPRSSPGRSFGRRR